MSEQALERNARVLGKAVHPAALARLHELFPEARVHVQHEATPVELPLGTQKMSRRFHRRPSHETRVFIDVGDPTEVVGVATCHHEDNFDRRKGIELAFRRALIFAKMRHNAKSAPSNVAGVRGA